MSALHRCLPVVVAALWAAFGAGHCPAVEVWVCGQSVIRGGNPLSDVLPGIRIAQSAMTFNINRPADGWTAIGVY